MSGTTISSEGLDPRRRRILFRAWHRGMREMDLIMGRFADAEITNLSEGEAEEFERLLEEEDAEVFSWISGAAATPADFDTALFRRLKDYHLSGRGVPD